MAKAKHVFQVIVEQDEAGYYVAECPALRACYTQGKTYEEVIENIKDVIALCLEDFKAYRPFLHKGSVITLHDTNSRCAGAGVKQVVDYLRTLSDCDIVDFPTLGEGTALVRIRD